MPDPMLLVARPSASLGMEWNVWGVGLEGPLLFQKAAGQYRPHSHVTISDGARLGINTVRAIKRYSVEHCNGYTNITPSQTRIAPVMTVAGFLGAEFINHSHHIPPGAPSLSHWMFRALHPTGSKFPHEEGDPSYCVWLGRRE